MNYDIHTQLCVQINEEAHMFSRRQNGRELVFSLHVSWGLCFCDCCLGCVYQCLLE